MSYTLQYQPPHVYAEGTWLYGAIVTGVLYGVVVTLYFMCARALWRRIRSQKGSPRKNWFFFIYVNFIFALSTVYVAANAEITQMGFINHRDYPGGPSAFEMDVSSIPVNVPFVISNWCADALMIWRCIVVYKDSKAHLIVTGFGCLLLFASVVTGALWVIIVSQPAQSSSGWMSFTLLFPYISVGLGINILISFLTVLRLLYHRSRILKALGPGYGGLYAGFAEIIIESAAVYSAFSLLYLIPYAVNSPLANAFMQILGEAQVIAPLLIILRVSEDKVWTSNMATTITAAGTTRIGTVRRPTQPASVDLHPSKKLDVEIALECVQHIDPETTTPFPRKNWISTAQQAMTSSSWNESITKNDDNH